MLHRTRDPCSSGEERESDVETIVLLGLAPKAGRVQTKGNNALARRHT